MMIIALRIIIAYFLFVTLLFYLSVSKGTTLF
jgi:hypothetical protein